MRGNLKSIKRTNKYVLNKSINYLFLKSRNIVLLKGGIFHKVRIVYLPSIYFYNVSANVLSFMFNNIYLFKSFLAHLKVATKNMLKFFFARLKIRGLGYKMNVVGKNLIRFSFLRNDYLYLHVPPGVIARAGYQWLLLMSSDFLLLRQMYTNIFIMHTQKVYNRRGLWADRIIVWKKRGKKKYTLS